MMHIPFRVQRRYSLALLLALPAALSISFAQTVGGFNEREVKPGLNVEDKGQINVRDGIWVFDFRFKDPRLITVDIPGKGRRLCWYLWYQVVNYTGQPRTLIPDFELVPELLDNKPAAVYHDQVLPKVQEAVSKIEDPTGHLNIKNSVTIASDPIPPSKPDAFARPVTGVAIWDDVDPEISHFRIFVSGLSNGWSLAEIPGNTQQVIRRKTLELRFKRVGDKLIQDSRDIRFEPPAQWIYRGSLPAPDLIPKVEEPAPKPADAS